MHVLGCVSGITVWLLSYLFYFDTHARLSVLLSYIPIHPYLFMPILAAVYCLLIGSTVVYFIYVVRMIIHAFRPKSL